MVWWTHAASSWSWRFPVLRWSCKGWTTPLQRRWACRSAPGRCSSPGRRSGSIPGSCRGTRPAGSKCSSTHSSTGHRLPGREGNRWSHTEAGCTDCSVTVPEPGVWPTVSWGTCRCPLPTGGSTQVESQILAHDRPPCLFPAGLFPLQSKVQAAATCAGRLHTFIDLLPRSPEVSSWRHALPESHLRLVLGNESPGCLGSIPLIRPSCKVCVKETCTRGGGGKCIRSNGTK